MSGEYHSFYLADLKALIREKALETMAIPMMFYEAPEMDIKRNSNVAIYNDGIKTFADALIDALCNETEEQE